MVTAVGMSVPIEGTPVPLVTKIPSFAVAIEASASAAVVYKMVFVPPNVPSPVPPRETERYCSAVKVLTPDQ